MSAEAIALDCAACDILNAAPGSDRRREAVLAACRIVYREFFEYVEFVDALETSLDTELWKCDLDVVLDFYSSYDCEVE